MNKNTVIIFILIMVTFLLGCGKIEPTLEPTVVQPTPVPTDIQPTSIPDPFPMTIIDDLDRSVTLPALPLRIVSLAHSHPHPSSLQRDVPMKQ